MTYYHFTFRYWRVCFLLIFNFCFSEIFAEDSIRVEHLEDYTLIEQKFSDIKSAVPSQTFSKKDLERINALNVSDAVKHFSGVTVKDYGGIGGLKTVSVRGLGTNHTTVSYDGISLSNCQSGQIDIGRFSSENISTISVCNGQEDEIFIPARLLSSASVLRLETEKPFFYQSKKINWKANLKTGSFGLINAFANIDFKCNKHFSGRINAEFLTADGAYPYVLNYGEIGKDSSSVELRKNSDVQNFKAEVDLFGNFKRSGEGKLKLYYYQSNQGVPGATIFYNTENFSSSRISDQTFFTQGNYLVHLPKRFSIKANAKYNYAYFQYTDPTALNSYGKEESIYRQHEFYASIAALHNTTRHLFFSASTDVFVNTLRSNDSLFVNPLRTTWLTSIASKWNSTHFTATASLLFTFADEQTNRGATGNNYRRFSPFASVSIKPFKSQDFYVRMFYKNIFRLPTFNDLYYLRVGNVNLKPEDTHQLNFGLSYMLEKLPWLEILKATADAYYNTINNKIVAYPTKNIYQWTMINCGKALIYGADFSVETTIALYKKINLNLGVSYSYQRALNVTDKNGKDYKHQLPYTPRVSGSGRIGLETPWIDISYTLVWSGKRYSMNLNYAENRLPAYTDHSLSASHEFELKNKNKIKLSFECLNLANENYAIVRYFPMPGRSFRGGLTYQF